MAEAVGVDPLADSRLAGQLGEEGPYVGRLHRSGAEGAEEGKVVPEAKLPAQLHPLANQPEGLPVDPHRATAVSFPVQDLDGAARIDIDGAQVEGLRDP